MSKFNLALDTDCYFAKEMHTSQEIMKYISSGKNRRTLSLKKEVMNIVQNSLNRKYKSRLYKKVIFDESMNEKGYKTAHPGMYKLSEMTKMDPKLVPDNFKKQLQDSKIQKLINEERYLERLKRLHRTRPIKKFYVTPKKAKPNPLPKIKSQQVLAENPANSQATLKKEDLLFDHNTYKDKKTFSKMTSRSDNFTFAEHIKNRPNPYSKKKIKGEHCALGDQEIYDKCKVNSIVAHVLFGPKNIRKKKEIQLEKASIKKEVYEFKPIIRANQIANSSNLGRLSDITDHIREKSKKIRDHFGEKRSLFITQEEFPGNQNQWPQGKAFTTRGNATQKHFDYLHNGSNASGDTFRCNMTTSTSNKSPQKSHRNNEKKLKKLESDVDVLTPEKIKYLTALIGKGFQKKLSVDPTIGKNVDEFLKIYTPQNAPLDSYTHYNWSFSNLPKLSTIYIYIYIWILVDYDFKSNVRDFLSNNGLGTKNRLSNKDLDKELQHLQHLMEVKNNIHSEEENLAEYFIRSRNNLDHSLFSYKNSLNQY